MFWRNVTLTCFGFINSVDENFRVAAAMVCTVLLGCLDFFHGDSISMAFFYLLPVSFVTWFVGKKSGMLLALLSSSTWLLANYQPALNLTSFPRHCWNGFSTFGFFIVVVLLLAKLKFSLEHAHALSWTDYLTGTFNGRAFNEIVTHEILRQRRNGHSLTLAYLDLDNFKAVNDTFGHNVGDELLQLAAMTMTASLRRTDRIARLGGDEFAILLPETDIHAANIAISKVQQNLLAKMEEKGWPVTSSIGVLTCEAPVQTPTEMLTMADKLMYGVKKAGKNALKHAVYQGDITPGNGPLLVPVGA
jgi:diguanylate cyclase (GGDEF)-like protein